MDLQKIKIVMRRYSISFAEMAKYIPMTRGALSNKLADDHYDSLSSVQQKRIQEYLLKMIADLQEAVEAPTPDKESFL